jgi:hypothetical protein
MDVDGREVSNFILGMECSGFNERKGRESDDNATELDLWRMIHGGRRKSKPFDSFQKFIQEKT